MADSDSEAAAAAASGFKFAQLASDSEVAVQSRSYASLSLRASNAVPTLSRTVPVTVTVGLGPQRLCPALAGCHSYRDCAWQSASEPPV